MQTHRQGEPANFSGYSYDELLKLYAAETERLRSALDAYTKEPCTRTVKIYQHHRDNAVEMRLELDRREEAALEHFPIERALQVFGVRFKIQNGRAYIL